MNESVDTLETTAELVNIEDPEMEETVGEGLIEPTAEDHVRPEDELAMPEESFAGEVAPTRQRRVFISHKQDKAASNDEIASRLATDLAPYCQSVYLDLDMLPGDEYVRIIEEKLSNSDFVIVLISEAANRSAWIRTELEYAHTYAQLKGSPRIIPVRLGHEGLLNPLISVYIGDEHVISFDPINDNYQYEERLLRPILEVLEEEPPPERVEDRLSGFVVHESRRQRFRAAFLEPSTLTGVRAELRDKKLLWVTGAAGVRNYLGLSLAIDLAIEEGRERIYEISKPRSWSQINGTVVGKAVIVVQDSTPAAFFEETTPKAELDSLRSLIKRDNRMVVTLSEDEFQEVEQEIQKEEFEYSARRSVTLETFGLEEKITIFRRLLDLSLETNALTPKHYNWVLKTLETLAPARQSQNRIVENRDKLLEILNKCTPADIDQFFTQDLRQVRQGSDFITLLQQNAGGDEEVHAWFLALDDSAKCFVLAVALCAELDRRLFWEKYKLIVRELRALDQNLALLPLGVGRDRARPFVTTEGPLDFAPRVADLIRNEVGANYREYLIELRGKLKAWSVPEGREKGNPDRNSEKRKREINETQTLRMNAARLIGTAAKEGLDKDVGDLLMYWGTDPSLKIRDAVATSLEQCAQDIDAANSALGFLKDWGSGSANDEPSLFKLYAMALPLTRLALANSGEAVRSRALNYLKFLCRDRRHSVQFYASIAVKKMARKTPFVDLVSLLSALAHDSNPSTKVNVAQALSEARFRNEPAVTELIQDWRQSTDENLRWVAFCLVLVFGKQSKANGNEDGFMQEVHALLAEDARTVADVYLELLSDQRLRKIAWRQFKRLTTESLDGYHHLIISGLAHTDFLRLDKILLRRLRQFGDPPHERLILEIRKAHWRNIISSSGALLADLRKRLQEQDRTVEVFQTLTEMLTPEPDGCRAAFIEALVAFYPQDRELLDDVLLKLEKMAPSVFEPFSVEVRRVALRKWFYDPASLVAAVSSDLTNPLVSESVISALESLAQPEPLGDRDGFLQAIAYAHALNATTARHFLARLKNSGNRALSVLSYEFTYRLLEGKLAAPRDFVAAVADCLQDNAQRTDALDVLERFAMPELPGKKRALIDTLAQARAFEPAAVDAVLQNPFVQSRPRLARLQFDVRVASILESVFMPRFVSRWFRPKPQ
jgi:hypothetical protein